MKKIMLAAVAASFMSTGAQALQLPAEGQVCSDIHSNISVGINNPDLSDYRKCVMIQHEIDTAFTYKTFWVRTGTEFTSFEVSDLAKLSRSERVEFITQGISKNVVEQLLEEQRTALEEQYSGIIRELAMAKDIEIADLAMQLRDVQKSLNDLEITLDEIKKSHEVTIMMKDKEFADKKTHLEMVQADLEAEQAKVSKLQADIKKIQDDAAQYLADFSAVYESLGYDPVKTLADAIKTAAKYGFDSRNAEVAGLMNSISTANAKIESLKADITTKNGRISFLEGEVERLEMNELPDHATAWRLTRGREVRGITGFDNPTPSFDKRVEKGHNDYRTQRESDVPVAQVVNTQVGIYQAGFNAHGEGYILVVRDGDMTNIELHNIDAASLSGRNHQLREIIQGLVDTTYLNGFSDGFEAGYKQGYTDGFDDGYDKGYEDGYNDGYADGRGQ